MWLTIILTVPLFYGLYQLRFSEEVVSKNRIAFCFGLLISLASIFVDFVLNCIFQENTFGFMGRFFFSFFSEGALPVLISILLFVFLFKMDNDLKVSLVPSFLFGVFTLLAIYLGLTAVDPVNIWIAFFKPLAITGFVLIQAFCLQKILSDSLEDMFGGTDFAWILLSLLCVACLALAENLWFFAYSFWIWILPVLFLIAGGVVLWLKDRE